MEGMSAVHQLSQEYKSGKKLTIAAMSAGHSEVLRELQLQRRAMEDHAAATRETSEVMRAINAQLASREEGY